MDLSPQFDPHQGELALDEDSVRTARYRMARKSLRASRISMADTHELSTHLTETRLSNEVLKNGLPKIRFDDALEPHQAAIYENGTVRLRRGMDPATLRNTLVHEVGHHHDPVGSTRAAKEGFAVGVTAKHVAAAGGNHRYVSGYDTPALWGAALPEYLAHRTEGFVQGQREASEPTEINPDQGELF